MIARLTTSLLIALPLSAMHADERMQYKGQPTERGADAPMVGEWIPDLGFETVEGQTQALSTAMGKQGLLIALRDPDCPLSKKLGPKLSRITKDLESRGFGILVVNILSKETAEADVEGQSFAGTYALDVEERIPRALLAETTTEVFLLDAARTLQYRGMIDDQYGLGFTKPEPQRHYLEEAVQAVLASERPKIVATQAQGCLFGFEDAAPIEDTPLTYHERIGRIVQQNCQTCHRTGGAGPFSLESFEGVKKRKGMIEWVLQDNIMPPWFAEPGSGPWSNDTSLTADERADFLAWIGAGAPEGDPAHAAVPVSWVEGWTIGEPDLVVRMEKPFDVPAEGVVEYQYTFAQVDNKEDRWVKGMEVRAGAPGVVHHVLVFLEHPDVHKRLKDGDREAQREFQEGSNGYFASTVPGQSGLLFPDGCAKKLPAGAWLKFQIHYTPNGTPAQDQTEIGLVFSDDPNPVEVRTTAAFTEDIAIPPKAFDHEVQASYRFEEDATILSLLPHTHLRGTRFLYELVLPDGKVENLLMVPFYDFNWQLNYELQTPRSIPSGTELRATAWYDNSEYNPANPAPEKWVRFGEQTFDEMLVGYVNWVPANPQ